MSQHIINKIAERTGATPKNKSLVYEDISIVTFESDTDYESIVRAATKIDAEVGGELLVWGCGKSDADCPRVAIQRLEFIDPDDVDGIDTYESTPGPSGGAAVRKFFSTDTSGN